MTYLSRSDISDHAALTHPTHLRQIIIDVQLNLPFNYVSLLGTIDKEYPQRKGGYAFEIGEAAAARVLRRVCGDAGLRRVTVCRKDSQEIKHSDRWGWGWW